MLSVSLPTGTLPCSETDRFCVQRSGATEQLSSACIQAGYMRIYSATLSIPQTLNLIGFRKALKKFEKVTHVSG